MKEHTMQRIENIMIGTVLGAVPVIACFVAGWWLCIPFVPESHIIYGALTGLLVGILIDLIFLRRWVRNAFSMKIWLWVDIYVFYSLGMFGLFMGVPIFNTILALPAGFFIGRRLVHNGSDFGSMKKAARQTAAFTTGILGLICLASASIALLSSSTASDIRGMLRLPFQVTLVMIVGIILVGGAMILALNWWLTAKVIERVYLCSTPKVLPQTATQRPEKDI